MDYSIRELREEEYGLLEDFLYEAIFVPENADPPPRAILQSPELQVYLAGFGESEHDIALAAEAGGKVVGAAWVRIMEDYGHVDDETPSFAISLYPEYRGHGIGTALMEAMLAELRKRGYRRASLAVQKANYALKLYERVGFRAVDENDEEYIMVNELA